MPDNVLTRHQVPILAAFAVAEAGIAVASFMWGPLWLALAAATGGSYCVYVLNTGIRIRHAESLRRIGRGE